MHKTAAGTSGLASQIPHFFKEGVSVRHLPLLGTPCLYFSDGSCRKRWNYAGFYPAFTPKARLFRTMLRLLAFAGGAPRVAEQGSGALDVFLQQSGVENAGATLMVGTPGPAQKLVAQIWQGGRVVAYLKFGVSDAARAALMNEADVLAALPPGLAPRLFKKDSLGDGVAILISPLKGRRASKALTIPPQAMQMLKKMQSGSSGEIFSFEEHPWIQNTMKMSRDEAQVYKCLCGRKWKAVLMHGDFAPWNLLLKGDGCCAYDWESGSRFGFPWMDLIHYYVQTARNLFGWTAGKTRTFVLRALLTADNSLSQGEAEELLTLCARWIQLRNNGLNEPDNWYFELEKDDRKNG